MCVKRFGFYLTLLFIFSGTAFADDVDDFENVVVQIGVQSLEDSYPQNPEEPEEEVVVNPTPTPTVEPRPTPTPEPTPRPTPRPQTCNGVYQVKIDAGNFNAGDLGVKNKGESIFGGAGANLSCLTNPNTYLNPNSSLYRKEYVTTLSRCFENSFFNWKANGLYLCKDVEDPKCRRTDLDERIYDVRNIMRDSSLREFYDAVNCDDYFKDLFKSFGGQFLLSQNCQVINGSTNICGDLVVRAMLSPISLLWEGDLEIGNDYTLVDFPLANDKDKKIYTWKASSSAPLLVYNPDRLSNITSSSQLFGNWSFGGKKIASLGQADLKSLSWDHGFEALATLDLNGDKEVSGNELSSIYLWFDKNRNSISEEGELVSAKDIGLTKLFYEISHVGENEYDLYAKVGFERVVNGKTIKGASVDWYAEGFGSKYEAISRLRTRGDSSSEFSNLNQFIELPKEKITSKDLGTENLSGFWLWHLDEELLKGEDREISPKGIISLKDLNGKLSGHIISEIILEDPLKKASSAIASEEIIGDKILVSPGVIEFSFKTKIKENMEDVSRAKFSIQENTFRGVTTSRAIDPKTKEVVSEFSYSWTAKRM